MLSDPRLHKNPLLPPGPNNPRNSEGAFVRLKDGRLLLAYSHFYGDEGRDDSPSYVAARYSSDGGKTWGGDLVLIPNEGQMNTMSVSFLRLQSGEIMLGYLVRNRVSDGQTLDYMARFSSDEAKSWSEPVCCSQPPSYYVVNNDRLVQLKSGRIVIPAADHKTFDGSSIGTGDGVCFLSDDSGRTWGRSAMVPNTPEPVNLQEPGLVELSDGRLLMLFRTLMGCLYRTYSEDQGQTWSQVEPTDLKSPVSPATCKRIPSTGDLLLVYNDHSNITPEYEGKRTPLVAAISRDEGETWETRRVLEDDPGGWYCYTAMHFEGDDVLLAHCAGQRATGGLNLTQVTRFPVSWLYE